MTDHHREERGAKPKEWVKGDAEDWALLPVVKEPKSARTPKAKGDMQRAWQIFLAWAYAGHSHGSPIFPKGHPSRTDGGDERADADVALAESALIKFAVLAGHMVAMRTRTALVRRHLDGKELFGADVLNAERCYRLVLRIERGVK